MVKTESEGLVITGTVMLDKLDLNIDRQSRIEGKNIYVQLINYREGKYRQSTNLFEQNFVIPYPDASPSLQNGFVEVTVELDHKKYRMITYQRPLEINGVLVGLLQVGAIPYNED